MQRTLAFTLVMLSVAICSSVAQAQIRLIGITGDLHSGTSGFSSGDETLFEINLTTGAATHLFEATHIPDSNTMGYNPTNGLIYHLGGSESYRDAPDHVAYNDNQYMETIHPTTFASAAVFNSNGPPSTDITKTFGLPAPRPTWVFPEERRTEEQTGEEFQGRGPNEYGSARGVAWSDEEGLFYLTSGQGFFKMTPEGDSTFLGLPAFEPEEMKGVAFVDVAGVKKLYASSKDSAFIYEINTADGQQVGDPIEIKAPPFTEAEPEATGKIVGLATHPQTNVLYGILQGIGVDPENRTLATINLTTGLATVIGTMVAGSGDTQSAIASFAFVGFTTPDLSAHYDNDDDVDGNDFLIIQRGIGTTHDAANIADWKAGFGNVGAVAAASAVPEPSALLIMAIAVGCLGVGRVRQACRVRS